MVVLASSFLECSTLLSSGSLASSTTAGTEAPHFPTIASLNNSPEAEKDLHYQKKSRSLSPSSSLPSSSSSPASWISFFLSQKPPAKPLLEDMGAPDAQTDNLISPEPVQVSVVKKPSKGGRRRVVSFTPQKARELRKKLKGTDSFHDLMYHSAIASRLASSNESQES